MATKPGNLAEWATGGSALITEPLLAEKQDGWVPETRPPAQWFNWWMNLAHLWFVWLDAFESEAHTWSALQTFSAGITVTKGGTSGGDAAIIATGPNGAGAAAVFGTAGSGTAGIGGRFVSTAASGYGVLADGVLAGLAAIGDAYGIYSEGGTLPGVYSFSATNYGGEFRGSTSSGNSAGVRGEGGGTGNAACGVLGVGSSGGSPGVIGTGTGSGGSGNGGNFYNSATAAAGVAAANFVSQNANGVGGWGVGTGSYEGILAEASGNAPALRAFRTAGPTALEVIKADGSISLDDAIIPAPNVGTPNLLTKGSLVQAWAVIDFNGTGAPTLFDGYNIDTLTQATGGGGNGNVTIDFTAAFGDVCWAHWTWQKTVGNAWWGSARDTAVGSGQLRLKAPVDIDGNIQSAANQSGTRLFVQCYGYRS